MTHNRSNLYLKMLFLVGLLVCPGDLSARQRAGSPGAKLLRASPESVRTLVRDLRQLRRDGRFLELEGSVINRNNVNKGALGAHLRSFSTLAPSGLKGNVVERIRDTLARNPGGPVLVSWRAGEGQPRRDWVLVSTSRGGARTTWLDLRSGTLFGPPEGERTSPKKARGLLRKPTAEGLRLRFPSGAEMKRADRGGLFAFDPGHLGSMKQTTYVDGVTQMSGGRYFTRKLRGKPDQYGQGLGVYVTADFGRGPHNIWYRNALELVRGAVQTPVRWSTE